VLVVWVLNHGYSNSTTVKVMYGLMSVSPFRAAVHAFRERLKAIKERQ